MNVNLFDLAKQSGKTVNLQDSAAVIGTGHLGMSEDGRAGISLKIGEKSYDLAITNKSRNGSPLVNSKGLPYYRAYCQTNGRWLNAFLHPSPRGLYGGLGFYPEAGQSGDLGLIANLSISEDGRVTVYKPAEDDVPF